MATNQTIPITLVWGPVPPGTQAADLNQLGTIFASQLSAAIRADVSFALILLNDPTTYQGVLIFNQTQNVWKSWNEEAGQYITVTDTAVGDIKSSVIGQDTVQTGWVVLNGRSITAIPGLAQNQINNLNVLFPSGTLPTVNPSNINGLPPDGSFSGLPVSGSPTQAQVEAIRVMSETLLDALNTPTVPTLYSLVFCSYPMSA